MLQHTFPLFAQRKWLSENKRCSVQSQQIFADPSTDVSDKHPCATATRHEEEQTDAAKVARKADGNLYIPAMSSVATEDTAGRNAVTTGSFTVASFNYKLFAVKSLY